jgi:LDH2 family malate/lactate/ureidoglycolate dehydrogenase
MVVANRSNHYGIAGYYSMQALKDHLIVNLDFKFF